jgi:hypothetical protein
MSFFGKSINIYADRVMVLRCVGKTNDEVHTDVFPLPWWNG